MAKANHRISPTAYATGHMWYRQGLSHPGLVTAKGRRLDFAFRALTGGIRLFSGVSLDALMLARHRGIDGRLAAAINAGRVSQIIELAAGFSARGWRLVNRFPDTVTYLETDLPPIVGEKQRLIQQAGLGSQGLQIKPLDALALEGADSLSAVARELDPARGTAIITEGLMNYLSPDDAQGLWQRIAATLQGFAQGLYLADFYLSGETHGAAMASFGKVLQKFVKGRMHVHFATEAQAITAMQDYGFRQVALHGCADMPETRELADISGADRVRVLEGWV